MKLIYLSLLAQALLAGGIMLTETVGDIPLLLWFAISGLTIQRAYIIGASKQIKRQPNPPRSHRERLGGETVALCETRGMGRFGARLECNEPAVCQYTGIANSLEGEGGKFQAWQLCDKHLQWQLKNVPSRWHAIPLEAKWQQHLMTTENTMSLHISMARALGRRAMPLHFAPTP